MAAASWHADWVQKGIGYTAADNAPSSGSMTGPAQELADSSPDQLHTRDVCGACGRAAFGPVLPLEPDAGGIRHRPGVPLYTSLGPLSEQLIRETV